MTEEQTSGFVEKADKFFSSRAVIGAALSGFVILGIYGFVIRPEIQEIKVQNCLVDAQERDIKRWEDTCIKKDLEPSCELELSVAYALDEIGAKAKERCIERYK